MADAKTLIEENLRTQNPYLDLGNCGLDGTEAELERLAECIHLETLVFSNEWREFGEEKQEYVKNESQNQSDSNQFTKIEESLSRLAQTLSESTNVELNKALKGIYAPLMNSLRGSASSVFNANKIKDFSFLQKLFFLQKLSLKSNNIQNVYLQGLENLISIDLQDNPLKSVSLKNLKNLRELELSSQNLEKLDLKDLPALDTLHIHSNRIKNFSFLRELSSLHTLHIH